MSKILYTSSEMKSNFNLSDKKLRQIRESNSIPYAKKGRTYQYELDEELNKSFFSPPVETTTLSTTTDYEHIEKEFGDNDLTLPNYNAYSMNGNSKRQVALNKLQERDQLIEVYRKIAEKPEVSNSIDEIINEILSPFETGEIVTLSFSKDIKDANSTKKAVQDAFEKVLNLLDFNNEADEIVRDWYRDGFVPFECVYNNKKITNGIRRIVQLTPFNFKKIKDTSNNTYIYTYDSVVNDLEISNISMIQDMKWRDEQIVVAKSGKLDPTKTYDASYLREALKSINDLSHIENSLVVYRITRANEKNIWNVDVGNLPNQKAKNHIAAVARDVTSNIKYNADTGLTSSDVAVSIQSNWLFPSRNGKQKTTVETIDGAVDFVSKLEDLNYFRKKVNEALRIPIGRLEQSSSIDFSSEDILREELKFTVFINKLRRRIGQTLFLPLIYRELIAKKQITDDQWDEIKQKIIFKWNSANTMVEKASANNVKTKIEILGEVEDSGIIGKYLSMEYILQNVLQMTKEEFLEQKKIIDKEREEGLYAPDEEEELSGGGKS